ISDPEKYIDDFCEAGSDLVIVHTESTPHVHRAIQQIQGNGKLAGVTINPATPLVVLEELFQEVDLILVMSVNPGFGNQKFIPGALKRIERLAEIKRKNGYHFEIEVDGGINTKTIASVCQAGADVLVAGSAIFNSPEGIPTAMKTLKTAAGK
ncbi:ribulose-phosphate 3-epimerase, partial [bacterium]|nr:ribulose-phosphate 3-epimerase [bacterium]